MAIRPSARIADRRIVLAKFMVQKGALKRPINRATAMGTTFLRAVDAKLVAISR